jgi:hypothetical protein
MISIKHSFVRNLYSSTVEFSLMKTQMDNTCLKLKISEASKLSHSFQQLSSQIHETNLKPESQLQHSLSFLLATVHPTHPPHLSTSSKLSITGKLPKRNSPYPLRELEEVERSSTNTLTRFHPQDLSPHRF